jgi:hypothetical protein
MFKKLSILFALALLLTGMSLIAGEKEEKAAVKKAEHVSLKGKLVCLGCDLKNAEGARAACSVYGHTHTLKTEDGKYINFLENQYSADLIKGEKYYDKPIEVHGIYFADANMLDVETFTVNGKKIGWCDHCKAMDQCPFMKKSGM